MMKNTRMIILAAATTTCTIQSCSNSGASGKDENGKYPYEADFVNKFMQGCASSPGMDSTTCFCILDKIQRKYAWEEINRISTKIQQGQIPQDYAEFRDKAREECGAK